MQHQQKLVQLSLKLLGRVPDTIGSHHLQEGLASAVLAFIAALSDPEAPQISGSQVSLTRWKHERWRPFVRCMQNEQCLCMRQQSYGRNS